MIYLKYLKQIAIHYVLIYWVFSLLSFSGLAILINSDSYFSKLTFEPDEFYQLASTYIMYISTIPLLLTVLLTIIFIIKQSRNRVCIIISLIVSFFSVAKIDKIVKAWVYSQNIGDKVLFVYLLLIIKLLVFGAIIKYRRFIMQTLEK